MRRLAVPLLVTTLIVAGGAFASANPAPVEGPLPDPTMVAPMEPALGMGGGGALAQGRHIDGRMAFLRAELRISPAQEPAWGKVEAVLRDQAKARAAWHETARAERQDRQQAPALPERLDRAEEMLKRRQADLAALKQAVMPLYASFTADQKAAADELLLAGPRRPHGHRRDMERR